MGRTLPSATQVILQEEAAFARFRRALRRSDQVALDDLFASARQHTAAAQYASHALPFEVFLLAMLLEEHKEVMKLRDRMESLSTTSNATPITLPGFSHEDEPHIATESQETEEKND